MSAEGSVTGVILQSVLTAASALGGVWISSRIEKSKAKAASVERRRQLLLEKLESLSESFGEALRWAADVSSARHLSDVREIGQPDAARRVRTLASIYFPPLKEVSEQFHVALTNLFLLLLESRDDASVAEVLLELHRANNDRLESVYREMHLARARLDAAISAHAELLLRID